MIRLLLAGGIWVTVALSAPTSPSDSGSSSDPRSLNKRSFTVTTPGQGPQGHVLDLKKAHRKHHRMKHLMHVTVTKIEFDVPMGLGMSGGPPPGMGVPPGLGALAGLDGPGGSGEDGMDITELIPALSGGSEGVLPSVGPPEGSLTPYIPKVTNSTSTMVAAPPGSLSTTSPLPTSTLSSTSHLSTLGGSETGEVSAMVQEGEIEYLSPVTIGGQNLNLNLDTGSADLWVFSTRLPAAEIAGHSAYDPSKSSTWRPLSSSKWEVGYGDGTNATGIAGYDTVSIGGVTVENQCIEIANNVSKLFIDDANSDGLVGLGWSTINTVKPVPQKTFLENIIPHLAEPVFTLDLKEAGGNGTYEFGKIDNSKYKGEIHYTPVDNSKGFWKIDTPAFKAAKTDIPCQGCWAIVDTGTSVMLLNNNIVAKYYSMVKSAKFNTTGTIPGLPTGGGYTYDCSEKLPDFTLMIGDYPATIKGSELTYEKSNGFCLGAIQSLPPPGPCDPNAGVDCDPKEAGMAIIGDSFLKHFFSVFDAGKLRFGMAEKK